METKSKINVCVIFGGASSEHEVSKMSVVSVLNNIDRDKYNVHTIMISKSGNWFYYDGAVEDIQSIGDPAALGLDKAIISPDSGDRCILRFRADGGYEKYPIDVAYPVLHGKFGEDGTIQGLFEIAGLPYVGPGVLGSAVCMDKCVAKMSFKQAGLPQADWVELKINESLDIEKVETKLGYPCFIKPANAGSSVGITKAHDRAELIAGVKRAFEHDYKILIEEMMTGTETETAVMGNLDAVAAECVGEIAPAAEFYDYEAKYEDENSKLTIPADMDAELAEKVKEYAVRAYKVCECRGLSRVDFFVDKETGDIRLNEINTLPGFTNISMYPKLWMASGLSYSEIIDRLIELALRRCD